MPQAYAFAGTTMTVLVPGSETGGAFAVLHVIKPPDSSTPPHSHDRELELSYVLAGTLSAETDGRIETRSPGEVLVLRPGRPHRLFNVSGGTVREFLLCAPAVFDRFVAAAGSPVEAYAEPRPMTGDERKRLVEFAPEFGVRLLRSADPSEATTPAFKNAFPPWRLPNTRVEVIARLGSKDDDLVLMRDEFEAGQTGPVHDHPEPECVFVVEGTLDVYRDGVGWCAVGPDQAIYIEPGLRHALRNAGARPVRLLTVSTVRMTRLLAEFKPTDCGSAQTGSSPEAR